MAGSTNFGRYYFAYSKGKTVKLVVDLEFGLLYTNNTLLINSH
jgi:hypothetical protein